MSSNRLLCWLTILTVIDSLSNIVYYDIFYARFISFAIHILIISTTDKNKCSFTDRLIWCASQFKRAFNQNGEFNRRQLIECLQFARLQFVRARGIYPAEAILFGANKSLVVVKLERVCSHWPLIINCHFVYICPVAVLDKQTLIRLMPFI